MRRHRPALMRLQVNSGEALQRTNRSLHAANILAHIELRHIRAFPLTGVRHLKRHDDIVLASRRRSLNRDIPIAKARIAQPEAKGKQWLAIVVDIPANTRWIRVIKVGQLADAARERDYQPARWIVIAKERLGDGSTSKLSRVPCLEDCSDVLLRPADCNQPSS